MAMAKYKSKDTVIVNKTFIFINHIRFTGDIIKNSCSGYFIHPYWFMELLSVKVSASI